MRCVAKGFGAADTIFCYESRKGFLRKVCGSAPYLWRVQSRGINAMADIDTAKKKLEARLAELNARFVHLQDDLAEPLDPDFAEAAVEREDDASLEGQAALVSSELGSVNRALDRIANGTYGLCVKCSGQISPERLSARPEAALCITCAKEVS
ncbi:TraR/DksA family transcriptional regulator [Novosphingobium sp. PY1]|nr:TraR/DksA family transcriptional regulator [Novosphingobium sp. PY1]